MDLKKVKKKDRARESIKKNQSIFKCPICSSKMFLNDFNNLACSCKHSFDLSKKGYLNLLTTKSTPVYSKELFEARHKVCEAGFYHPLIDEMAKIIDRYEKSIDHKGINILDAGCGEGSHIYGISKKMVENQDNTYVGVDISKDSINIAARNNGDMIWCVADLAKLPFQNKSFHVVLNILSPANYGEFNRILREKGMVIKVVPGSQYLKELRETIYKDKNGSKYSNSEVIHYFKQKLEVKDLRNIHYKFDVKEDFLPYFIKMTPLTWGGNMERFYDIYEKNLSSITVDLTIIIGTKK